MVDDRPRLSGRGAVPRPESRGRQFRLDFGVPDRRIGVDSHGFGAGVADMSRKSKAADHEKVSEAALCGWIYIICDAVSVQNGKCAQYIDQSLARRDAV